MFMENALAAAGKNPRSDFARWNELTSKTESVYDYERPTITEPLVFHIFGRTDVLESLVITADDHMQLLQARVELVLPRDVYYFLRSCRSTLMWLGVDFEAIGFRTLYHLITSTHAGPPFRGSYFDREFERMAEGQGRHKILLREFMAELQSWWKREGQ